MNIFKKTFCRVFQSAFHMALPVLPYKRPEILGKVSDIAPHIQKLGYRSVLLVTDGFLRSSGLTKKTEKLLASAGIRCAVYDRTEPNPTTVNVEEALKLYKSEKCECLIAFGGGSPMDCAKAVGARAAYPKKTLAQLKGTLRVFRKIPYLIAIPTTAGTGSEVTVTAVITEPERHYKYTMNAFPLIPRCAVLDPEVTFSLPPSLTATTGLDALTHAVEAYIGNSTSKQTRQLSLDAVRLIFSNIEKAYNDGSDRNARENMLRAAFFAGEAFSKSYVGYIHAVAHTLGGMYGIAHGLANSVIMPYVLEEYGSAVHKKLHELGIAAGVASVSDTHEQGAKKFISAIRELEKRMGIPEKFTSIKQEDIPEMARRADREANPLYPVPVLYNAKELERFYYMVKAEETEK